MTPVFQTLFINRNGTGNCFNACVASLYDIPLSEVPDILPNQSGVWFTKWRKWFLTKGLYLDITSSTQPPEGYTIVSVSTDRIYPEGHKNAGEPISHACIALDGVIVHDPYPEYLGEYVINYFYTMLPHSSQDDF